MLRRTASWNFEPRFGGSTELGLQHLDNCEHCQTRIEELAANEQQWTLAREGLARALRVDWILEMIFRIPRGFIPQPSTPQIGRTQWPSSFCSHRRIRKCWDDWDATKSKGLLAQAAWESSLKPTTRNCIDRSLSRCWHRIYRAAGLLANDSLAKLALRPLS